jgi:ParB-like chromosome segregation protein Spo0J
MSRRAAVKERELGANWPASEIIFLPIEQLIPHARNARMHSPEQVAQIASSMREFGWVNPILVDEQNILIAGHGRILAAPQLGWKEAPCMVARDWSEAKKRAYMIADNKLALNATWNIEMLDEELKSLQVEAFSGDLLGFSAEDLARLDDDLAQLRFDSNASFEDQTEESDQDSGSRLAPDQVNLSVPMTVAERALVFEAITAAKIQFGMEQGGPALCQICRLYLNRA